MSDQYPIDKVVCSDEDCTANLEGHAWSKIKSNWFFQKNGQSWCPNHHPEWYTEWKEKKVLDG